MVYAYASKPTLTAEWHIEEIAAYSLTEATGKYKELKKKYPNYSAHSLVGGPTLEKIKQVYKEKWY